MEKGYLQNLWAEGGLASGFSPLAKATVWSNILKVCRKIEDLGIPSRPAICRNIHGVSKPSFGSIDGTLLAQFLQVASKGFIY